MKFKLSELQHFHSEESAAKLRKYGFTTHPYSDYAFDSTVTCAINLEPQPEIEINTIEELVAFMQDVGQLIVGLDNGDPQIIIYNDYAE